MKLKKLFFVFPGQGSQFSGMGKDWYSNFPRYQEILEEASDATGLHFKKLSLDTLDIDLRPTEIAQPLILAVSVAMWRVLKENFALIDAKDEIIYAGHSLGEYTALVAAGVLDFAEALKTVQKRGQLMNEAFPQGKGSMRALLLRESASLEKIKELCAYVSKKSSSQVSLANWNTDTQVVVAGEVAGLEFLDSLIKNEEWKWVRKSIALDVSGPFHSPLMKKAADNFSETLKNLKVDCNHARYIRNVDAQCVKVASAEALKQFLEEQIYSSVLWYPTLLEAKDQGVNFHIEISPSKVLTNMASRAEALKEMKCVFFADPLKVEETLSALRGEN